MKRFTMILMAAMLAVAAIGQNYVYVDTLRVHVTSNTPADTIIAFPTEQVVTSWSVDFTYKRVSSGLNAAGTVSLLVASNRGAWKELHGGSAIFPMTLDPVADFDTLTDIATQSVHGNALSYPFMAVRYKKGSATSGDLEIVRVIQVAVRVKRYD